MLGRSAFRTSSGAALVVALAVGLGAAGCSLDDSGPASGPLTRIVLHYESPSSLRSDADKDLLVERVTGRLAQIGVDTDDESFLVQAGDGSVAISCRGCEDLVPEIREVVPRQGQLRFRPVLATASGGDAAAVSVEGATPVEADVAADEVVLIEAGGGNVYRLGPTAMDGRTVVVAGVSVANGQWQTTIRLSEEAQDAFDELALQCNARQAACPTGQLAIVVDGEVMSAPTISQPSFEPDQIVVSSDQLDETTSRQLANVLQWGPLPVRLGPAIITSDRLETNEG